MATKRGCLLTSFYAMSTKNNGVFMSYFTKVCESLGMKGIIEEYKFHPTRRWRIDYYFTVGLAVEIEGGVFNYGRHNRASGFIKDIEKYNCITEAGIFLLRYQPKSIDYNQIKKVYDKLNTNKKTA